VGRLRVVIALALALGLGGVTNGSAAAPRTDGKTRTSRWFWTEAGSARRVFTMPQPAGVVLLTRLTTTYGIKASVAATVPRLAGVRVLNYGNLGDPSPCRRQGSLEICTQSQEGCPMPKAVWRVHVLKTGGPAGLVRFDFVVGKAPKR
jgi:hypothetical protein